jgi:hypothetical protein
MSDRLICNPMNNLLKDFCYFKKLNLVSCFETVRFSNGYKIETAKTNNVSRLTLVLIDLSKAQFERK